MSQQSDRAPPLTAAESEAMARAMELGAGQSTSGRQRRQSRESITEQQARRARLTSGEARRTAALADAARAAHLARHAQGEAARVQHMSPEDRAERQAHRTAEEATRVQHMSPEDRAAHLAYHAEGEAARVQHMSPEDRAAHQAHHAAAVRIERMTPLERAVHHAEAERARIENMAPDERTAHQAHHAAGEANRVEQMAPVESAPRRVHRAVSQRERRHPAGDFTLARPDNMPTDMYLSRFEQNVAAAQALYWAKTYNWLFARWRRWDFARLPEDMDDEELEHHAALLAAIEQEALVTDADTEACMQTYYERMNPTLPACAERLHGSDQNTGQPPRPETLA